MSRQLSETATESVASILGSATPDERRHGKTIQLTGKFEGSSVRILDPTSAGSVADVVYYPDGDSNKRIRLDDVDRQTGNVGCVLVREGGGIIDDESAKGNAFKTVQAALETLSL